MDRMRAVETRMRSSRGMGEQTRQERTRITWEEQAVLANTERQSKSPESRAGGSNESHSLQDRERIVIPNGVQQGSGKVYNNAV